MQELKAKELFAVVFTFAVLGILGFNLVNDDDKVEKSALVESVVNQDSLDNIDPNRSNQKTDNQQTIVVSSSQ